MSLSPKFQLWALVKISAVQLGANAYFIKASHHVCCVYDSSQARRSSELLFLCCALFRNLKEFVFKFVQGCLSIPFTVSLLIWRCLPECGLLELCVRSPRSAFWNIALIKNCSDGRILRPTSVCGHLWSLLRLIGFRFIICWGVGDGSGASTCQTQLLLSWPVHWSSILKP